MRNDTYFTYVLYLNVESETTFDKESIFLGSCEDPIQLYKNGLYIDYVEPKNKANVLEWIYLVEQELSSDEKYDLEYAFMHNPEDYFSYSIKHMELHIKKINKFD